MLDWYFETPQEGGGNNRSSLSPDREVIPGHLMRLPQSRGKNDQFYNTINFSNRASQINAEKAFSTPTKTFASGHDNNFDRNQWSKREEEWFEIEGRLVFKHNEENRLEKDMNIIKNWISSIKQQKSKADFRRS